MSTTDIYAPLPTGLLVEDGRYEMCVCGWYSPIGSAVCNREMHDYMTRRRTAGCTHETTGTFARIPFTRHRTRDGVLRCSACGQGVEP